MATPGEQPQRRCSTKNINQQITVEITGRAHPFFYRELDGLVDWQLSETMLYCYITKRNHLLCIGTINFSLMLFAYGDEFLIINDFTLMTIFHPPSERKLFLIDLRSSFLFFLRVRMIAHL
ncbi:hypothetical protein M3N64_07535 [Sporolactobacillus sp. CPB3-1]|uniref:Uncharacterized protein n=1 Tax=Sporolactobacillus mangiferae TaxID=2940498 RepID=A0ABT0MA91_9BACL|nr:hypothetical protein [Sporolactobacillus mangiferae]MCL1631800.1 hypothetical protein [Sporolactobacillus mangiferae]